MTTTLGQALRRTGLVIEALCMLGLLGLARGKVDIWNGFPVDPSRFLSVGLGCGLILWVAGTVVVLKARRDSDDS